MNVKMMGILVGFFAMVFATQASAQITSPAQLTNPAQLTDAVSLQNQINTLLQQIQALQTQLSFINSSNQSQGIIVPNDTGQSTNATNITNTTPQFNYTGQCINLNQNLYRFNSKGDDVKLLQGFLVNIGLMSPKIIDLDSFHSTSVPYTWISSITGIYGPATESAVATFQKRENLPSGWVRFGAATEQTRERIRQISCSSATNQNPPTSTTPLPQTPNSIQSTVDLKVNGQDGPIFLKTNEAFSLAWTTKNISHCQLGTPFNSGADGRGGSSGLISPTHPFYPSVSGLTYGIKCYNTINQSQTTSDSITVYAAPSNIPQIITPPTVVPDSTPVLPLPGTPIIAPSVKINNPLNNNLWTMGDTQTFKWSTTGLFSNATGFIDLVGNGTIYRVANVSNSGNYLWNGVGKGLNSSIPAGTYSVKIIINGIGDIVGPLTIASLPSIPAPTVDLKVNGQDGPITVPYNTHQKASWVSTNATNCSASHAGSGTWNGTVPIAGSDGTGSLTSNTTILISCVGSTGQVANDKVTIYVTPQTFVPPPTTTTIPAPTVNLSHNGSSNPVTIVSGGSVNLNWNATNIYSCQILRNGALYNNGVYNSYSVNTPSYSGTFFFGSITAPVTTYTITCTGPSGTASAQITVNTTSSSSSSQNTDSTLIEPDDTSDTLIDNNQRTLFQLASVIEAIQSILQQLNR